jgi:hypothetical protein
MQRFPKAATRSTTRAMPGNAVTRDGQSRERQQRVRIGLDSCCVAGGTDRIRRRRRTRRYSEASTPPSRSSTSAASTCATRCPVHRESSRTNKEPAMYLRVDGGRTSRTILARHFAPKNPIKQACTSAVAPLGRATSTCDYGHQRGRARSATTRKRPRPEHVSAFLKGNKMHIATEHHGEMDPASLDEYLQRGGFMAVEKLLYGNHRGPRAVGETPGWQICPADRRRRMGAATDHRRDYEQRPARPRRRGIPDGPQAGNSCTTPKATRNTSSATATRATRARSWTG